MKKTFRLILINGLVFVGLLLIANICVIFIFQAYQVYQYLFTGSTKGVNYVDSREKLPNYKKKVEYAKTHFKEFYDLKSEYKSFFGWRRLPYNGHTITINNNGIRETPQHPAVSDSSQIAFF